MHKLHNAEDAAHAIRLSAKGHEQSVVVLVCDGEDRVVLAVDFAGAPASGVREAVECVLDAVTEGTVLVVGIVRPHDSGPLRDDEAEAVEELLVSCQLDDVYLRDLILVFDEGCRSMLDVAIRSIWGNNGRE